IVRELLDFSDLTAAQVMVPRVRVVGVQIGTTPEALRRLALTHRRTRYIVYDGDLDHVEHIPHAVFGFGMPASCPNVPSELLIPENTWSDKEAYARKANELGAMFVKNFEKYASQANEEILGAAPRILQNA
ncbi:MAG TPA: hypothetical protein PLP34_07960, partial [Chitinophagaceae bacterium]|nr:hypothetical protein [Chitinophagaceae bacterium]